MTSAIAALLGLASLERATAECTVDALGNKIEIAGAATSCALPQEQVVDVFCCLGGEYDDKATAAGMHLFEVYDETYRRLTNAEHDSILEAARGEAHGAGDLSAHEAAIYLEFGAAGVHEPCLLFKSLPYLDEAGWFRSDIRALTLSTREVRVLYSSTNTVNGGNLGFDGRLYYAFKGAKVGETQRKPAGIYSVQPHDWSSWRLEVDNWGGKPFNSPNDVVMRRSDGSLWFTDPI